MSKSDNIYNALEYARNKLKSATEAKGAAVASPYSLMDIAAAVQTIENGLEVGVLVSDSTGLKVQPLGFEGTSATANGTAESYAAKIFNTGKDEPAYASGGGTSAEYYKCASVDTEAKTWSGYKAIQQENGGYAFEETVTTGLTYTTITPVVDSIYSADCMILVGYMVPAASASIPDSTLYIYMPLQEDISEPTANTTVYDSGGTSLTFNTVDGLKCAVFGGSSSLRLNGISSTFSSIENVTFSFWAKVNSETANSTVLAFYVRNLIEINASDKCNWLNYDGSSYTSFTCDVSNTTSWNHYAFVKDGSVWKVYLNGVMIASKTDANSYFSIERDGLYIGTHSYNTSAYWKGWLTKLRIYTKVLTDAEILACAKELTPTA